jgi:hypothetical protein
MRLFCHLVFLVGDMAQLAVEGFGQRREELDTVSHGRYRCVVAHTSASRESRSWLGTPMSSNRPCSWPMMVVTCWARYEVSMVAADPPAV